MKSILKEKYGFSLIEILVSMTIFMVILTLVMFNYRRGEDSNTFTLQAFDIEDSIRSVQNMALTGKEIDNYMPNAYGIFFGGINGDIIIYGDDGDNIFNEANDSVYSKSFLHDNISFGEHTLFCEGVKYSIDLNIVFIPPKPTMIINNDSTCSSSVIFLSSSSVDGVWSTYFDTVSGRAWTEFNQ